MFEEMTFSERLQRNLKLESWGVLKPSIDINALMETENGGLKNRSLQDCCFRFIELIMEGGVTMEVKEKVDKLKEKIRERIRFLAEDLKEDEDQFIKEGAYKENYSELEAKYNAILGWRSALATFSEKEFKPLNARKVVQTKVDDAKRWNSFLDGIGAKNRRDQY